ncbi:MAG: peptidylprolyl isomerase [Alistipes sp.]|nr:peptidylprolyl isomerase [Alistipes sp.]
MKKIFFAIVAALALASCSEPQPQPRRVEMRTTAGDIVLELSDLTPIHRDNFMQLVEERYFDSLLFHRVIENFMIQGGDPRTREISGREFFADGEETGDPSYWEDIPAEINFPTLYHKRGALAAAREGDNVNPQRRSSRTQFYIVWGRTFDDEQLDAQQQRISRSTAGKVILPDSIREVYRTVGGTPHLDGQYTVFGHVVSGLEIVDKIQRSATDSLDRPVEDVRILSVREVK